MSKLPSFQFYPGDWLRDNISGCSLAAQGLWLRMMILMHDSERYGYLSMNGAPIPPGFVSRKCGCDTLEQYTTLLAELDEAGIPSRTSEGIIYSRRMVRDARERERKNRNKADQRSREKGVSGDGDVTACVTSDVTSDVTTHVTGGVTDESPRSSSSSSSSKRTKTKSARAGADGEKTDFDHFWSAYPRKVAKGQALKAWEKLNGQRPPLPVILGAIAAMKAGHDWSRDPMGSFVKHPATWLNALGWEDEQPGQPPATSADQTDSRLRLWRDIPDESKPYHAERFRDVLTDAETQLYFGHG